MMMAMLMILCVGLLSLSTIALRTTDRDQPRRIAQANARMALMIAIGELQKHGGKDQRITGTADLAGTAEGDRLAAGAAAGNADSISGVSKGLSTVQHGTRHWTGIWKNSTEGSSADPGQDILSKTPSPQIVQWLVSGNERGSSIQYRPDSREVAVGADGKPADPSKAVVLAGPHTVGKSSATTLDHYVSAPLVSLKGKNSGRYAWWVGDEGVKAKFNMKSPYGMNERATPVSMSSRRRGWELVEGFESYPLPGSDSTLNGIVSMGQAGFLGRSINEGQPSPAQSIFHSATTESYGVISDTLNGGLRVDLTSILNGLPNDSAPGIANPPRAGGNMIAHGFSPEQGPTWDRLAEFSQLRGAAGGSLSIKAPASNKESPIGPVIVDFRLLLGAKVTPGTAQGNFKVYPCGKIAITLANPYTRTLRWTDPIRMEIKRSGKFSPTCIYLNKGTTGQPSTFTSSLSPSGLNSPLSYISMAGEPAVLTDTIFEIPGGSLNPGEAIAYTQSTAVPKSSSAATVRMVSVADTDPQDFNASVIQENNKTFTLTPTQSFRLDVREADNSSQIDIILTTGGRTLRHLRGFELDNVEYAANQRFINPWSAAESGKCLALQLYAIQLSQPGIKYAPAVRGLRSSTSRTFADFNLRAAHFKKPIISYNPPPYFMRLANSFAELGTFGSTGSEFTKNLAVSPYRWGRSPESGSTKTVLFDIPEQLTSIAQLQHCDLTADDKQASVGHQPGNAVGNSYATPFVKRQTAKESRTDYRIEYFDVTNTYKSTGSTRDEPEVTNYFDLSYLLNASLWDTYFFSTLQESGEPLNGQIVKDRSKDDSDELKDGKAAASHLLIDGAFNINSTDKNAWKVLLSSSKYLSHPNDSSSSQNAYFPRSTGQPEAGRNPPTGNDEDSFSGYRRLTDEQIDALAGEIVKQVRLRGPFVSISHFINRCLTPADSEKGRMLGRSGALQAAIDESGVNISARAGNQSIFTSIDMAEEPLALKVYSGSSLGAPDFEGTAASKNLTGPLWAPKSRGGNPGSVASIYSNGEFISQPELRKEQGYRSTGIPGWLTQADVLQVIGTALSARSDTFRIRAYGDAVDANGKVLSRAWCEAIVQRTASYVDASDAPTERGKQLEEVNLNFGRRMKLVSFRWLSPDEI